MDLLRFFGTLKSSKEVYVFGRKGNPLDLFNEAEVTANEKEPEPKLTEIQTHYRKKAKQSSGRLPEDLPVEIIEHSLEDDTCPTCAEKLHVMGKKVRRELKLIPARAVIVEQIHYVYSCRNCEKTASPFRFLTPRRYSRL